MIIDRLKPGAPGGHGFVGVVLQRARQHSGVLVVDLTGKAQRLGETLAHELRPEDIDVLTVCVDQGLGDTAPRAFARQALDHMDQGPILTL